MNRQSIHYVDSFWIDQNEVTNGEFTQFVEATGYLQQEIPLKLEKLKGTPPNTPRPHDSFKAASLIFVSSQGPEI